MTVDAILTAIGKVQRRTYDRPAILRCAPNVAYEIMVTFDPLTVGADFGRFGPPGAGIPDYFDPRPGALGMRLETDEYLPPGAWRLCDEDDTLLYDCREGTSP